MGLITGSAKYLSLALSRLADRRVVEEGWPHGRHALGAAKRATDGGRPLIRVPRRPTAQRGGLDGLVQLVVGIALWAVGGQEAPPQPIAVAPESPRGDGRGLPGMAIHDQKDGLPHLPEQAAAELAEDPRREPLPNHHEGQPRTIGDRRDPVTATAPAGAAEPRGLAALAPPGAGLLGRAQPHLVAPVERGPRARGRCPKPGRLDRQPALHRRRISLSGPSPQLLRGEAPSPPGAPNSPARHPTPLAARAPLTNRVAGPQGARQGPRRRTAGGPGPDELGRWPAREPAAARAAPRARLHRVPASPGLARQPGGQSGPPAAEEPTALGRGTPRRRDGGHGLLAHGLWGVGRQVARLADSRTHDRLITIASQMSRISCSE
jgi:hypothetical protein